MYTDRKPASASGFKFRTVDASTHASQIYTHDETEDVDTRRARVRTPISVPRAETPDDDVLARAVASLRAEDPAWSFAHEVKGAIDDLRTRAAELESAARADAEYREAADKRIADLEAAAKRTPFRRIASIVGKVASIGAVTMALTMTARALVSHGRATEHAEAREALLDDTVRRLTRVESRAAARASSSSPSASAACWNTSKPRSRRRFTSSIWGRGEANSLGSRSRFLGLCADGDFCYKAGWQAALP